MTSHLPKLLIVDQSLRDMAGHHYEYDVALFRAAAAAGVAAVIGAHVSIQGVDLLGGNVRPWFRKAWYESQGVSAAGRAKPMLGWLPQPVRAVLRRMVRGAVPRRADTPVQAEVGSAFGEEVLELIRAERLGSSDHVLIHTFNIAELDSVIELARRHEGLPLIHIVFRRDAEEPMVASGPNGGIRSSLTRLMSSRSAAATLRLYADTEDLARQYSELVSGLEVEVVPIPHCLPPGRAAEQSEAHGPLRIAYLGDARDEKGFHLLADLVDAVAARLDGRARFVIQGNVSAAGDNPSLAQARRRLAAYPRAQVELMTDQLDLSAFHDLLRSADIVLLPYDRRAYARRSSGIFVQALAAGRVVVVPAETWMARQADPAAAVLFEGETRLADAVMTAVQQWPALAKSAQQRAPLWRARHEAARYIAHLLEARR
jgi:glycosyltransferase involved in cell wall biosynthesis